MSMTKEGHFKRRNPSTQDIRTRVEGLLRLAAQYPGHTEKHIKMAIGKK
jgi:hypothetical protein